jgi:hypothetical protein
LEEVLHVTEKYIRTLAFVFTNNIRCPKHGDLGCNLPESPENRLILPKNGLIGRVIFHGGKYLDKLIIEDQDGYVMGTLDGSEENGELHKQIIEE